MTESRRNRDGRAISTGSSRRRRFGISLPPLLVLCLGAAAGATTLIVGADHDERTLAYRDGHWSSKVYVAAFGDPMEKSRNFRLLLPPPGQDLCHLPPDLEDGVLNTTTSTATTRTSSTTAAATNSTNTTTNTATTTTTITTAPFLDYDDVIAIGLLIPRGRGGACSEETQTLVALQIRERIPALRYLIIHGTDGTVESETPVTLDLRSDTTTNGDVDGDGSSSNSIQYHDRLYRALGVMYMPYTEYVQLETIILEQSQEQNATIGASPYLLDPASADWQFLVSTNGKIRIITNVETSIEAELFYWLRMVLFIVLIVTPCFRAGYLWYAGGGRLHWRRNENGRIVGILYVPAMPIWLWLRRQNQHENDQRRRISPKLSEEQFNQLPVITYQQHSNKKYLEDPSESAGFDKGQHDERDDDHDEHDGDLEQGGVPSSSISQLQPLADDIPPHNEDKLRRPSCKQDEDPNMELRLQRTEDTDDMNLVPSTDSLGDSLDHSNDGDTTSVSSPTIVTTPLSMNTDDDAAAVSVPAHIEHQHVHEESGSLATTCTMCSICIDDFETGEELVLLPRCKHAFHKECIYPWLLERQGCCPLCKVRVFDDDFSDDPVVAGGTTSVEEQEGHHPVEENQQPDAATGPTTDSAQNNDNRTTPPMDDSDVPPPPPPVDDLEVGRTSTERIVTLEDCSSPVSDPTNHHDHDKPIADDDLDAAMQRLHQVEVVLQELPTMRNHQ
jgi:Ring finger domain